MAGPTPDRKAEELARSRTLNPRPEAVVDEAFASAEFFDARDLVQVKYEWTFAVPRLSCCAVMRRGRGCRGGRR